MKNNILLPISPIFVEKIFCGEKKYEYRKRICKQKVQKIYFYATFPQKCIVGEAEVLETLTASKEELWEKTKEASGITCQFYFDYFNNQKLASAYSLGKVKKYNTPIRLEDINIFYTPQSYVYIEDISYR